MAEQVRDYAVFLLDPEGNVVSWNIGAQLIKGYGAEEIIGKHFSTFYAPDAIESRWPWRELALATREGRFEDEGWRVRKDGTRFWANVTITALRDENGRLLGFSKITRDITERRRHEERLRQSEERFRLLVESVADYAIYMLDPDGVVTSWNLGAERIKGYTREEIVGRHYSNFFPPEEVIAGKPWEELALARKEGRAEVEGWRLRKDGQRFWARAIVTALYDAQGQLRGFAKVTQDLTQRRHVQELEAAAKRLNEFIAVLAHEIRNPLSPLDSALAVMRSNPQDPALQAQMREVIGRQTKRLARIADDMASISRITRGALTITKTHVLLEDVLAASVEVAGTLIQSRKHTVELDVAPDIVLEGDFERLVQVFGNLLNNAAKYTPEGGNIAIKAIAEDGECIVSVRDTGRGIHPDELHAIFRMFVQGRSTARRMEGGMGVGLALARNIVELHGGSLQAFSEGPGKGAEFVVRLPGGTAEREPAQSPATAAVAAAASPKRVLIADDNADFASAAEAFLRTLGHETRVALDGPQALALFDAFHPDVVLLDIGMPGIDGHELARLLRARAHRPELRIVAMSGWARPEDRRQSLDAGFDLHLAKPVDHEALLGALAAQSPVVHQGQNTGG